MTTQRVARSSWRIDHDVGCRRPSHLRLIPGAAALLVGESVDDGGDASWWRLVHYRTDDGSSDYSRGCDSSSDCDWVVAAAATVVAATAVVTVIDVDVDVSIDVGVY